MRLLTITQLLLYTLLFVCCNNASQKTEDETVAGKTDSLPIAKAKWLLGTWENASKDGNMTEKWEQINDTVFSGESYIVQAADTVFFEYMKLEQKGNQLLFTPTVKNQNNEQPVVFTSTYIANEELIFENPAHDFPKKISYKQVSADSLLAEISAIKDGKEKKEQFPMKRRN